MRPLSISLRDSNEFFKSGSSEGLDFIKKQKIVVIFRQPEKPEEQYIFNTNWEAILKDVSNLLTFQIDEHNRLYIDRLPRSFPHILSYLESGTLDFSALNEEERRILKEDVEFFQFRNLQEVIKGSSQMQQIVPSCEPQAMEAA
eukprot:TRINITY_DN9576_c0_g1_i1.p2 TRINITY_DN9576_c0_g1~~TRINITY_DN9576_c0_g1_i1.p2  ORF type:complete len:144 (+),score=47.12 TRINITY_DN9576_c0_g1_i1:119-550(+)